MTSDSLSNLLKLRLLVGYLGENDQFGWWKTSFYQAASVAFLNPLFPRTSHIAQYHGVAEAARLVHDESLSVGAYHLFRLPEELEHNMHTAFAGDGGRSLQGKIFKTKDGALDLLRAMASSEAGADGPVSIGRIDEVHLPSVAVQMASIYASAFQRGGKAFPYLTRA